jgi:hypothetical protein
LLTSVAGTEIAMDQDNELNTLQAKWQQQTTHLKDIDMEQILGKTKDFNKSIRLRNWREWTACSVLVPFFLYRAMEAETLWSRLMYLELGLAGTFIAAVLLYRGGIEKEPKAHLSTVEFIQLQKKRIENQKRLLSKVRYWYVGPIFFGLTGLELENAVMKWSSGQFPWGSLAYLLILGGLAVALIWLNEVKAIRQLTHEYESLS